MTTYDSSVSTDQLMHYVLHESKEKLGHTALVKLLYFADIRAREFLGGPLTDFNWGLFKFGPFPDEGEFYAHKNGLIESSLAVEHTYHDGTSERHHVESIANCDTESFPPEVRAILNSVIDEFDQLNRQSLSAISYETAPVKTICPNPSERDGTEEWTPLPMEISNLTQYKEFGGLNLKSVLIGQQQANQEQYQPWEKIRDEAKSRINATG